METFECPNCSAAIPFHASTLFTVCGFCQSMAARSGVQIELIGRTSTLPPEVSPIQVGTQGKFGETSFTVLGRVRLKWALGRWNEWFLEFGDGTTGWLAETQGFFMVSRASTPETLLPLADLRPQQALNWAGVRLTVSDVKETEVAGCEGELPFIAPPGRRSTSADLTGANSTFGCLEYSGNEVRSFFGRYCRFEELELTNLRPVPGWFGNPPLAHEIGVNAVNCPECGGGTELRVPGSSVTVACGRCGSVLDIANPDVQLIAAAASQKITPKIPLGSRGKLLGIEYEAVGLMQRADGPYSWFEYLLFNPHHGYTWLVNYNGHWNFVERLLNLPEEMPSGGYAMCQGEKYQLFLRGTATVRYVIGEFYWRVDFGEKAFTSDYIHPPDVLSKEQYPELNEVTWSRGTYLEAEHVRSAFELKEKLPEPTGVYLNQPNPWDTKGRFLGTTTTFLLLLLVIIQLTSIARARNETVASQSLTYVASATNQITPILEFEIKGKAQAIKVTSSAAVANSWMELAYELRHLQTGQARQFLEGVEYYYGTDWAEGSPQKSTVIPAVIPGRYQLLIDPAADPQVQQMKYTVQVNADVPVWRNFFICLTALLIYPLYRFARASTFEKARWAESDVDPLGPVEKEDDADE